MTLAVTIVMALLSGGVITGLITVVAQRSQSKASARNLDGDTYANLLTAQALAFEKRLAYLEGTIAEMTAELAKLRSDNRRMRDIERRVDMPVDAHPMSDFVAGGWLSEFNFRCAHPRGLHFKPYADNFDEAWWTGHEFVLKENAPLGNWAGFQAERDAALDEHVERMKASLHANDNL